MYITDEERVAGGVVPWWLFRRYVGRMNSTESGGPIVALRWLLESVYLSFVRYCHDCHEHGMPSCVPPGCTFTPYKFWRAFWHWCQPMYERTVEQKSNGRERLMHDLQAIVKDLDGRCGVYYTGRPERKAETYFIIVDACDNTDTIYDHTVVVTVPYHTDPKYGVLYTYAGTNNNEPILLELRVINTQWFEYVGIRWGGEWVCIHDSYLKFHPKIV